MANFGQLDSKGDSDLERQRKWKDKSSQERQLKDERKKFKRNQKPKGPRRNDWTPDTTAHAGQWDADEYESSERIMPKDEGDRRRALERAAFARLNVQAEQPTAAEDGAAVADGALAQGMVTAIASALCRVIIGDEELLCHVRGILHAQETGFTNALAAGDQVLVRREEQGHGVVEKLLPRRSLLARPDVFFPHLQQLVVANADQVLIVASWRDPVIWFELIDRYLVAAARNGLPATICVNKIDLASSRAECEEELRPYRDVGIPYLLTSTQSGVGIDDLRSLLLGRTTVFAGLSGVGKSSLLSAIQPQLNLRVGNVSDHSGEGRHTTTQATMLRLDKQSWVVDTPGIREFGLSGMTRKQLVSYFPEIEEAGHNCRFRNCSHRDEPGCAVQAAVTHGEIGQSRMHSYRSIYVSLPESAERMP